MCMVLPTVIKNVVNSSNNTNIPNDTVFDELKEKAKQQKLNDNELSMSIAVYMLGFNNYIGFCNDI